MRVTQRQRKQRGGSSGPIEREREARDRREEDGTRPPSFRSQAFSIYRSIMHPARTLTPSLQPLFPLFAIEFCVRPARSSGDNWNAPKTLCITGYLNLAVFGIVRAIGATEIRKQAERRSGISDSLNRAPSVIVRDVITALYLASR